MKISTQRNHYLSQPQQQPATATVLIFPTWAGLSDFEKQFADNLAHQGFNGLAIDLYGEENNPVSLEEKSQKMAALTDDYEALYTHIIHLIEDAVETTSSELKDGHQNIYSLGFCLGGKLSLMAGLTYPQLSKAVSLHGLLDFPFPEQHNTQCQFLICNGNKDPMVTSQQRDNALTTMNQKNLDWQLIEFSNTFHSFMLPEANNPENGVLYNAQAAQRAMAYLTLFLNE